VLPQEPGQPVVSDGQIQLDSLQFFCLECNVEVTIIVSIIVLSIALITGAVIYLVNKLNTRT